MCELRQRDAAGQQRMAAHAAVSSMAASALDFPGMCATAVSTLSVEGRGEELILDSGATDHVLPDRSDFCEYSTKVPLQSSFVYTADGKSHPVLGVGTVKVELRSGGAVRPLRLHALHVPSLGMKLVSMICLNDRAQIGFTLSERGVTSLLWRGRSFADVRRHASGLLILPGRVVRIDTMLQVQHESRMGDEHIMAGSGGGRRMGVHVNMAMTMPGKGLFERTPPSNLEKETQYSPPSTLPTLNPVNLKSTGLQLIADLLGGSQDSGGARGRDLVEEYKSRMWGNVLTNYQTPFQPCALPDIMRCHGLGGRFSRRSGSSVRQLGCDRGPGWPSHLPRIERG